MDLASASHGPAPHRSAMLRGSLARPDTDLAGQGIDLAGLRAAIDARLNARLPCAEPGPGRLHAAMRHAALAPGKRLRPLLCVVTAQAFGRSRAVLDAAAAIEMVHAASLILDDLPCMDDAHLRRGQPTTHLEYGEGTAILASVGLLNLAFALLAELAEVEAPVRARLVAALAGAVGSDGLVGGQEQDLRAEANAAPLATAEEVNGRKTAALIVASVEIGGLIGGADRSCLVGLQAFAREVGLAFQVRDDLLDRLGSVEMAGKDVGRDGAKPTIVALAGLRGARERLHDHLDLARRALARCGPAGPALQALLATAFPAEETQ